MVYVNIPKSVKFNEVLSNNYVLAPSKYLRFSPKKTNRFFPLSDIVTKSNKRRLIKKEEKYLYAEIGNINVETGFIDFKEYFGFNLPTNNPLQVELNDIIVSTVRTYRRGIGLVTHKAQNIVGSPAIFLIRDIDKSITKEYLLTVLRSDFVKEQILGLQNRGMYPRLCKDTSKSILIPIVNDQVVINYISTLTKTYLNKEIEIRNKHNKTAQMFEKELFENQKTYKYVYHYPKLNELIKINRLDTGVFTFEFKYIDYLMKNYVNDFFYIDKKNIKSGNTPKSRIISNEVNFKYCWITPTNISDFGLILENERIMFKNKKNNLNKNCMLIINRTSKGGRGEFVGISAFFDYGLYGDSHHNQGIYQVTGFTDTQLKFMTCFMNSTMIRKYCAGLSVGSKMKEIKSNQISTIPFPNFPASKQKEIADLYHNPNIKYNIDSINLENFLEFDSEFNEKAGIIQLDQSAKKIKSHLDNVLDKIINDEDIDIDFSFLNS
jgi:restriction endonuclease S subunit